MNRILLVSLDGLTYQVDEDGYTALRVYLDAADARLRLNPDKEEILKDLERSIGEKCAACVEPGKNVVSSSAIREILEQMGPVVADAAAEQTTEESAGDAARSGIRPPRLHRKMEGALIAGVCTGFATYFNVDVLIVRAIFVVLTILTGLFVGVIGYLVLALVIPARDPATGEFTPVWNKSSSRTAAWILFAAVALVVLGGIAFPWPFMMFHRHGGIEGIFEVFLYLILSGVLLLVAGIVVFFATVLWKRRSGM